MILALDVHYRDNEAKSVCIVFDSWTDTVPREMHIVTVTETAEYEPGAFYKRELPCLLKLLERFKLDAVTAIIIDGYVLLDNDGKPGLGAKLYEAIGKQAPVIGVAKTRFYNNTKFVKEVLRGSSKNPLFITSIGIPIASAAQYIEIMHGNYRMPALLQMLDTATKN